MQIPKENLDDFMTGVAAAHEPEPPPQMKVLLQPSGKVEVLKPLARWEQPAKAPAAALPNAAPVRRTWGFGRTIAFAGLLAVIAIIAASVAVFTNSDRPAEPVASQTEAPPDQPSDANISAAKPDNSDTLAAANDPAATEDLIASTTAPAPGPDHIARSLVRRQTSRSRILHAAYIRPRTLRQPRITVTDFVPTTMVIYAEKGEIKTRIEPQLSSAYKKPLSLPN